jgi:orotate phosphoribosyltransferase
MPTKSAISLSPEWLRLREIIRERSLRTDREYILSSGEKSGYYFDMKPTTFDPEAINLICPIIYSMVSEIPAVYLGGLAVGARLIPLSQVGQNVV